MKDRDRPKAAASARSPAECPRTRGRKIATRISAEKPTRSHAVPDAPMCANRCLAIAALSCVETTASTTSAGDGNAPRTGVRSEVVAGVELTPAEVITGSLCVGQDRDDAAAAARREVHAAGARGEDRVVLADAGAV